MVEKIHTKEEGGDWGKDTNMREIEKLISSNKRILTEEELASLLRHNAPIENGSDNKQENPGR